RVELIAAGAIRKGQPLQIAAGSRLIPDNRAVFPIAVGLQGPDGDTGQRTAGPAVDDAGHAHGGSLAGSRECDRVRGQFDAGPARDPGGTGARAVVGWAGVLVVRRPLPRQLSGAAATWRSRLP